MHRKKLEKLVRAQGDMLLTLEKEICELKRDLAVEKGVRAGISNAILAHIRHERNHLDEKKCQLSEFEMRLNRNHKNLDGDYRVAGKPFSQVCEEQNVSFGSVATTAGRSYREGTTKSGA